MHSRNSAFSQFVCVCTLQAFSLLHFDLHFLGVMHDENLPRGFHLVPSSFRSSICVRQVGWGFIFFVHLAEVVAEGKEEEEPLFYSFILSE